jgi:hypothetical protein
LGARRCTPSMSWDCVGGDGSCGAGWAAECAFWSGERPGSGEFDALPRCASRARFFPELDRWILFFSASIPFMCGSVGLLGGGVGGMSPVMPTRASMPALRSLRAACGEILKMSSTCATRVGDETSFSGLVACCSLGSAAGTGGGGGDGTALESLPWPASSGRGSPSAMSRAVWLLLGRKMTCETAAEGLKSAARPGCRGKFSVGTGSSLNRCSGGVGLGMGRARPWSSPGRPGRLEGLVYPTARQLQSHGLAFWIDIRVSRDGQISDRQSRRWGERVADEPRPRGRGAKLEGKWRKLEPSSGSWPLPPRVSGIRKVENRGRAISAVAVQDPALGRGAQIRG